MPSSFERFAVQRLVDQAAALGVEVPGLVSTMLCGGGSTGARIWAKAHPDDDRGPCCYGSMDDAEGCTCWRPVYADVQQPPRPPQHAEDLKAQLRMCGDCAFRKGSPERAESWSEEALFALADEGKPFWCHDGMRRPVRWQHPDGRTVPGDPDDWQPPMVGGIPYQLDGSPALLCAGWMGRLIRGANGSAVDVPAGRDHDPQSGGFPAVATTDRPGTDPSQGDEGGGGVKRDAATASAPRPNPPHDIRKSAGSAQFARARSLR